MAGHPRARPAVVGWGGRRNLPARAPLEPGERPLAQLGIAHRVLDLPMAEVELDRPRVGAVVGELVPGAVPQRVWMGQRGRHLRFDRHDLQELVEPLPPWRRPTSLTGEYVARLGMLAPELA